MYGCWGCCEAWGSTAGGRGRAGTASMVRHASKKLTLTAHGLVNLRHSVSQTTDI